MNAPACDVALAEENGLRLQQIKGNKGLAGLHSLYQASCMYSVTARNRLLFFLPQERSMSQPTPFCKLWCAIVSKSGGRSFAAD